MLRARFPVPHGKPQGFGRWPRRRERPEFRRKKCSHPQGFRTGRLIAARIYDVSIMVIIASKGAGRPPLRPRDALRPHLPPLPLRPSDCRNERLFGGFYFRPIRGVVIRVPLMNSFLFELRSAGLTP